MRLNELSCMFNIAFTSTGNQNRVFNSVHLTLLNASDATANKKENKINNSKG